MARIKRKQQLLYIILGAGTLLGLLLFLFFQSPVFEAELSKTESHLEIGQKPENDPSFYLEGNRLGIALSRVDTSAVKHTRVGRYPVKIYHGLRQYTSYINVTDTTAPVVRCDIKTKTVVRGDTISVNTLGLKIDDYSEIESILFCKISSTKFYTGLPEEDTVEMREAYRKGIPMEAEEFKFAYGGIYTLTIRVSDIFHNTTDFDLILKVEEPPVIDSPANFYVATGSEIDFKSYIEVWDFISGDMDVEDVSIDTSNLKISKAGTYPVVLSATDDYGLTATKNITVHVSSQTALQELINTHQVNTSTDTVIGAFNAYDIGYFPSKDISFIQNAMLPSVVHVENNVLDSFGSGFILEINEDFVTIATNEHVINMDMTVDITFYDGRICNGAVVAQSPERDIAFIRIPINENSSETALGKDYVKTLRTVHINKGYWDKLSDDCGIVYGYVCIDASANIWKKASGRFVEKEAIRDWNEYKNVNETIISTEPVPGSSGSALFDTQGRLVGMIRGYTNYDTYTETVAVPLSELLKYFEIIFKYKIQYQ